MKVDQRMLVEIPVHPLTRGACTSEQSTPTKGLGRGVTFLGCPPQQNERPKGSNA